MTLIAVSKNVLLDLACEVEDCMHFETNATSKAILAAVANTLFDLAGGYE
jgi:hypothetical protein